MDWSLRWWEIRDSKQGSQMYFFFPVATTNPKRKFYTTKCEQWFYGNSKILLFCCKITTSIQAKFSPFMGKYLLVCSRLKRRSFVIKN